MPRFKDLAGQRFGRLIAVELAGRTSDGRRLRWMCRCDCGQTTSVRAGDLSAGYSRSCGCLNTETSAERGRASATHGLSQSTTYHIWDAMVQRCHNPKRKDYPSYGGAGIAVCERWRVFANFLADMGERPPGLSIDRHPNGNGNYEPGNCRWATGAEQVRNSAAVRMVEIAGRTQCIADWRKETGIAKNTYQGRVKRGWSEQRALTTPPDQRCNSGKKAHHAVHQ